MQHGLCGVGAALFIYGLLSLVRLSRWARARATDDDAGGDGPTPRLRRALGRHGEFGACGLLLAVTTAGFHLLVSALLEAAGVFSWALALAAALALGALATVSCTHALVELAHARARCAALEAATLGAFRKIAILDDARRTSDLRLARALREKEEAETREAATRAAAEAPPPAAARRDPIAGTATLRG